MTSPDTIRVPILTRVEGEGAMTVRLKDSKIDSVELNIFEPPRLFEALLRGRPLEDTPDITARICGICPVAYQMSSVHALEAALGVQISGETRLLRRLLYCGEWIESHALHIHLLHAPDFFGAASGMELAVRFPEEVRRGLQLKKFGNRLLEVVGGRAIHPVNVRVGGFHRWPNRDEIAELVPHFESGLKAALDSVRWVAGFDFPDYEAKCEFVAVSHPDEYAMNEGSIVSSLGMRCAASDFDQFFQEKQVAHSTALQSARRDSDLPYFLGPLARLNLNRERLSDSARRIADEVQYPADCRNPFKSIIARAIEVVHAYDEALSILKSWNPKGPPAPDYQYRDAEGYAATEAPRGMLFHHYKINAIGKIVSGRIIPPTSQNQKMIECDVAQFLSQRLIHGASRDEMAIQGEQLVRTYDPCISCSTHFLKVRWENL